MAANLTTRDAQAMAAQVQAAQAQQQRQAIYQEYLDGRRGNLQVGMTILLPCMIAFPRDIHASASIPAQSEWTLLGKRHPAIVLEINRNASPMYIKVALLRTFLRRENIGFMQPISLRQWWAPVQPALWEEGVDAQFYPPIPLEPLANGEIPTRGVKKSWVYLGKVFKFSYNTPIGFFDVQVEGPIQQRFSAESLERIIQGLVRHQATEEDVTLAIQVALQWYQQASSSRRR